jgi:hypothetical protein
MVAGVPVDILVQYSNVAAAQENGVGSQPALMRGVVSLDCYFKH